MEQIKKNESPGKIPHIYVILFLLILIGAISTYFIPAGEFERVVNDSGAEVIEPGTFETIESSPVTLMEFVQSIPLGVIESIEIIFGVLATGGLFAVIERTGIIDLGVSKLARTFSKKGLLIIPTLMIPFALFTTFTGQVELAIVYLPAILPLILKLGYDKITAGGIVLIATIAGFAIALTVPANLGTAQQVAELPFYSGIGFRIIILTIILLSGIYYVWRYAKKIQGDPKNSIVYGEDSDDVDVTEMKDEKATKRQIIASIVLGILFVGLVIGLLKYGWYFKELAGLYIVISIIVGTIAGIRPSGIAESFNKGCQQIMLGALVVGFARGVSVVLEQGQVMDTIIYTFGEFAKLMPESITAVGMLIVQALLNFIIPSGSGQAVVTMPIMSGLADLTDVTRQTSVLAFLMGDGFSNIFYPTSGYFMATLAMGGIKWEKWVQFIWPLLIIWYLLCVVFLIIAQAINYGPM